MEKNFVPLNERLFLIELNLYHLANNVFLIKEDDGDQYILVDTGSLGDYRTLWKNIKGLKVKYIIISHSHFDHCGNAKRIKQSIIKSGKGHLDPKIIIHKTENKYCSQGMECENHGSSPGMRFLGGFLQLFHKKERFPKFSGDYLFPLIPDEILKDLRENFGVSLVFLPGHSKGMLLVELQVDETRIHLGSDLIFPSNMGLFGSEITCPLVIEGTKHETKKSWEHLIESWWRIVDRKPDEIYFSHIRHVENLKGGGFKISHLKVKDITNFLVKRGFHRRKEESIMMEVEEEIEGEGENITNQKKIKKNKKKEEEIIKKEEEVIEKVVATSAENKEIDDIQELNIEKKEEKEDLQD